MANAILDSGEELLPMAQAARKFNRCTSGIVRWIIRGCTAADGTKVHLEAIRIGHKWQTSEAALNRFFERLSVLGNSVRTTTPTLTERRKQVARAEKEMEAAGA